MLDRSFIGFEAAPRTARVELGELQLFARATGEADLIYFDESAAKAAGHPSIPAPPTFTFCLSTKAPARDIRLDKMGVDLRRVLHAEQAFTHHRMIYAGDEITFRTKVSEIYEKKGGALDFLAQETQAFNQHGELCTEMRVLLAVRNS